MRILGMPGDTTGCGTYRMMNPLAALKRMGHQAGVVKPGQPCDFINVYDPSSLDIIVGQRVSGPGISAEWQRLSAVKGRDYRLVYEIDDDLWNIDRSNTAAWDYYCGDRPRQLRMIENIKASDLVTVTTEALADLISVWNPSVTVLPNYVDEAIFGIKRKPANRFTVGCGGSTSHLGDWEYAGRSIGKFLSSNPDVVIHFIGSEFAAQLPSRVAGQIFVTPWANDPGQYFRNLVMDVGLAPLRPSLFNRSKSHLKALEYAALGIPCVAAAYEPYEEFVQHGVTGFLARRDEYAKYLRMLYCDDDMRAEMSRAAIEQARQHTIQGNAWRWLEAYQSILTS